MCRPLVANGLNLKFWFFFCTIRLVDIDVTGNSIKGNDGTVSAEIRNCVAVAFTRHPDLKITDLIAIDLFNIDQ